MKKYKAINLTYFNMVMILMLILSISNQVTAQTWLEKSKNSLSFGSNPPPFSGTSNLFSEPYDSTWRKGFTGIGTFDWPKVRLQVHNNADLDIELDAITGSLGGYENFTSIFSNGGTDSSSGYLSSIFAYTSRSDVPSLRNWGIAGLAIGDNVDQNVGVQAVAIGDNVDENKGFSASAEGDNNDKNYGVHALAEGNGANDGNIGVRAQCSSNDPNSVNIGVDGRGIWGTGMNPDEGLYSVGVRGSVYCGPGGATQFNCGVYGVNFGCSDSITSNSSMPTGSYAGYFDGNVLVTGNVWSMSDQRLKKNVRELESVMDKLREVKVYSYNYNQNLGLTFSGQTHLKP